MTTTSTRTLPVTLLAVFAIMVATAPPLWAKKLPIPFDDARIRFEKNATDNDLGVQVDLDGDTWRKVQILDPHWRRIFEVEGRGPLRSLGLTELFFESEEPSLDEVPLEELLAMFPEGTYTFIGTTVDGEKLVGWATLTHNIPDGPVVVSPLEGAEVDSTLPVVLSWQPVTTPAGIVITGYQVIVEGGDPSREFSVRLPATTTSVTVPPEFLQPGAEYDFEVLAIEEGGNQTITETSFKTQ